MNLIAYSDSESDGEAAPAPKPAPKPGFAKVVDRSNPGKIKVNLPGALPTKSIQDDIDADAPPAKKPRLGGAGAFGGFNAMLPAPKKPATTTASSTTAGKRGLGKGLAAGVNLKTGAEPAFKREHKADTEEYDEQGNPVKKEPMNKDDFRAMLNLPPPKSEKKESVSIAVPSPPVPESVAPVAQKPAAPRFMPLSVGRGKKKKPVAPRPAPAQNEEGATSTAASEEVIPAAPPRKPKISLFGVQQDATAPTVSQSSADYQPLLHGVDDEDDSAPVPHDTPSTYGSYGQSVVTNNAPASNELTNIASELNLSEAERRQLFGKRGKAADFASAKIVEFNTDTEYAHNEMLRQQGEQVQHNPLKSISGTGKNSLRSLVNVASTQKDALEDHFAAGHRNKKEAGNRYGW